MAAMETITDHRSLIDGLGGNKVVADQLTECTPVRVGQWKLGNRIPVEYWPGIIAMAEARNIPDITSDWLMNTVRPRSNSSNSETEAA